MQVTLHEAAAQLAVLGKRAWAGERIVIAQDGEPYLELIPYQKDRKRRRPGCFKGKIAISDDFTKTPADVIGSFYVCSRKIRGNFSSQPRVYGK